MTKKQHLQTLERLDNIHKELRKINENLDDAQEDRKTQKTEISFLLSIVGVGISVSSLLVKSLSGDSQVALVGGGISLVLLITVLSFMRKISRQRPVPREIILLLAILFMTSVYSIVIGLGIT